MLVLSKKIPQQEEQKSQFINDNTTAIDTLPSIEDQFQLSDQDKKKIFKGLVDQEINKTQLSVLKKSKISDYSTKYYKLLYCGTRDGFTASKFHEMCDGKGPTISFYLSECGLVFGGYASLSWTSPPEEYGKFYKDPDAFVFSLSNSSIHEQYQNQDYTVYHHKIVICKFGGGNMGFDICITDNCDQNNNSFSYLGGTYELPKELTKNTEAANKYLAGKHQFKILEIQVYSLQ
eukprot:403358617